MSKKRAPKHLKPVDVKEVRKPINFGIYFVVIFIILIIAAVLIGWDRFTIREIEIDGTQKVNYLEVVHLSGIEYMSNIFTVDLKDVKLKIEQNPLLKVTEIKRKLPDTILITIEEREPIAAIKSQDKYVVINKNCITLEVAEVSSKPVNIEVLGTAVNSYQLGDEISLIKDIHLKKLKQLFNALADAQIQNYIATIDISFTENIKLYAKDGYEIQIGNTNNIENKCLWIKTMIPKLIEEGREGGVLYITNVDSAHYIAPELD